MNFVHANDASKKNARTSFFILLKARILFGEKNQLKNGQMSFPNK